VDYVTPPGDIYEHREIEEAWVPCQSGTVVVSYIAHQSWPVDHKVTWILDTEAKVLGDL
jgi:hypothetical protein